MGNAGRAFPSNSGPSLWLAERRRPEIRKAPPRRSPEAERSSAAAVVLGSPIVSPASSPSQEPQWGWSFQVKSKHIICMWRMHYVRVLEFEEKSLGVLLCVIVRISLVLHLASKKRWKGLRKESIFESTWKEMEEEWGTKDNSWLNRLYESRNKWNAAFGGGIFSCGISSTQRSEGSTNIFWLMPANSMNLIGFVHHYEQQVKYIREAEVQDDHNSRGIIIFLSISWQKCSQ
ncbi:hypothetical protein EUGRSUZ_C01165 [Eucalyptus grandis]|uniref:Uncharacterized protein n=2 Tax=Eucalyptus grandis TaxID=71139 RepID=A0ACC3LCY8_EUCGR|nr:hypothetical protein EUGRSUZ_C01165 [Eucalyptus grandis]